MARKLLLLALITTFSFSPITATIFNLAVTLLYTLFVYAAHPYRYALSVALFASRFFQLVTSMWLAVAQC